MRASARWFGWITVVMLLHMTEQLLFGIGELDKIKRVIAVYDGWFASKDIATVVLVTIGGGLVFLAIYGILRGGRARLTSLEALGLLSVSEIHHWVETVQARAYTPGLVTSVPFAVFGLLLMRSALQEYRAAGR